MYGVPEQLNLAPFVGTALDNIWVCKYQLQFVFSKYAAGNGKDPSVTVEGYWEIRDAQSELIDKAIENEEREVYKIHRLIGHTVSEAKINAPKSFTLVFDNGWTLTFFDDFGPYESCHVNVGDGEIHI